MIHESLITSTSFRTQGSGASVLVFSYVFTVQDHCDGIGEDCGEEGTRLNLIRDCWSGACADDTHCLLTLETFFGCWLFNQEKLQGRRQRFFLWGNPPAQNSEAADIRRSSVWPTVIPAQHSFQI